VYTAAHGDKSPDPLINNEFTKRSRLNENHTRICNPTKFTTRRTLSYLVNKSNILLRKQPDGTCKYINFEQLHNDPDIYDMYHKAINYIIIDY